VTLVIILLTVIALPILIPLVCLPFALLAEVLNTEVKK
jgi:hypothetical protein